MIVVDASALIELLLKEPSAPRIEEYIFIRGETLHVPHLIDVEAAQVIRRHVFRGQISESRGLQAIEDLTELALIHHSHTFLLPRVWELCQNLTAYDAIYVTLAEFLRAPLITRDSKLAESVGHKAQVVLV